MASGNIYRGRFSNDKFSGRAVDLWKAGLGLLPAMVLLSRTLKLMCFFASLFSIKSCFFDGLARVRDDYTSRVTQL